MKNINDELLNEYLDDELDSEENSSVKTAMNDSLEVKKRYEELLKTHNLLKSMQEDSPSINFTKLIMKKLSNRSSTVQQQKYFLFSVLSLFGLIVLGITGFVLYQIISSIQPVDSNEVVTTYSKGIVDYISNLFGQKNIHIFGSILSLIMIVSGYFLFEYQKSSKKNFGH